MSISAAQLCEDVPKRNWYQQGFDATPLLLGYIGEGEVAVEDRKPAGMEGQMAICVYENRRAHWYFDLADIARGTDTMIQLAKQDPDISKKLRAAWQDDEQQFEELIAAFQPSALGALDDAQLMALYEKYHTATVKRYTSTSVIDHFALGSDQRIADMIRAECGPFANEQAFQEVFAALTAPVYQSFLNIAEVALLDVAKNSTEEAVETYRTQFFWKKNNYVDSYQLAADDVRAEIAELVASRKDIVVEREKLVAGPRINTQRKAVLLEKYHVSALLRTLIAISDDFSQWQDERKRSTFLATYVFDTFLQEVAKRMGHDHELLKQLLPTEVKNILANRTPSESDLRARLQLSVVVYTPNETVLYSGVEAQQLRDALTHATEKGATSASATTLRGLVAHTGVATGPARIVLSATQMHTVQQGDILVAVMTRPDYLQAMKKAAAIVTDEGGITCHAAIISRELGIPCIIGTRLATQVLRNGMQIRVDANNNAIDIV